MHTDIFPGVIRGRGVKLTTDFHLVPSVRVSGAIPSLPFYAFLAWTETTLTPFITDNYMSFVRCS